MRAARFLIPPLSALLLSACIFGGGRDDPPSRAGPIRPRASGPVTLASEPTRETRQCFAELSRAGIRYNPLPDRDYGGGCLVAGSVQLLDIGVPVTGLKAMRCPLAEKFSAWVRHGVAPAAREILGSDLVRVETYGTYACRGIVGGGARSAGRLSEHGLANAVDVAAFILSDGRRISVLNDWRSPDPRVRDFMMVIHRSACRRFRTVLGPNYNAAHHNHFHFDLGGNALCS